MAGRSRVSEEVLHVHRLVYRRRCGWPWLAKSAAQLGGIAGRLGGDEFVLLLPDHTDTDRLVAAAGRVRQALTDPIPVADVPKPVALTCVIGLASPEALPDPDRPFFRAAEGRTDARGYEVLEGPRLVLDDSVAPRRLLRSGPWPRSD